MVSVFLVYVDNDRLVLNAVGCLLLHAGKQASAPHAPASALTACPPLPAPLLCSQADIALHAACAGRGSCTASDCKYHHPCTFAEVMRYHKSSSYMF